MLKSYFKILCIFCLSVFLLVSCQKKQGPKPAKNSKMESTQDSSKPGIDKSKPKIKLSIQQDSAEITNIAIITTSLGKITVGLFGSDAPKTVKNFIGLAEKGYYNGILIHRVAKNFLIQTGDRNTVSKLKKAEWGKGGQSYYGKPFEDELFADKPSYKNGYFKGTLAMANRGQNTNTSQFFICLDEAMEMDKRWPIFGKVIDGMSVVEKINTVKIIPGPFEANDGLPEEPIKIISVVIKKYNS